MDSSKVYLVQTDTTVGFLSSDDKKLSSSKKRSSKQKILQVVDSFKTLKTKTRVPNKYKNMVRRSKKTTFIYPNTLSFRVVHKDNQHHRFIKKFNCLYSTSANETKKSYDDKYAFKHSEIIVYNGEDFSENNPSKIYILRKNAIKKIR